MQSIENKVILITGAAGNLGRVVAERALSYGARIIVTDWFGNQLENLFQESNNVALFPDIDLSQANSCREFVDKGQEKFGEIDGLISTVGGFAYSSVDEDSYLTWEKMVDLNMKTTFHISQAILNPMKKQGRGSMVLTAATAASKGPPGVSAYASSKSMVMRFTESLAGEVKQTGIRVNAVAPSVIDTPENRSAMPDTDPIGWVSADEIADVMLFLISDHSRGINGAIIPVTGKG